MMIHAFSGVERFLLKQFDTWTIPGSSPGGGATLSLMNFILHRDSDKGRLCNSLIMMTGIEMLFDHNLACREPLLQTLE